MTETFEALLKESLVGVEMNPGKLITGRVVEVNNDYVMVSAGLKSDAEIATAEFKDSFGKITVQVGDEVEVSLDAVEDGTGSTRMSRERAVQQRAWETLSEAHAQNSIVHGVVTGKVKGGFTVSINGLRGFLPGSLVDVQPVDDEEYSEGRELELKIIKFDRPRNNIVVSRRAVLENETGEEREKFLDGLKEGMLVKGTVKNMTEYGAFVNLGGIDGLLHITDMAWKRVRHPSHVLTVGQELETRVLKFDREQGRVSLGLKQLGEDPWLSVDRRYPLATRIFGTVTNLTDYGAFVELEEGVEGLVHLSEMDWTNKNIHPGKICSVGDEVEVMVLDIEHDRRRISLGMKQCHTNPWAEFAKTHQKGDIIKGKIRSVTDFGLFVGVEGDIDGLVHLSDLSWTKPGEEAVAEYKKGDELRVQIIGIDAERERISLGLKQLQEDPLVIYISSNPKGSVVVGTITEVTAKGAAVELAPSVLGYLRVADISRERVEDARSELAVGEQIKAKIVSVDKKERDIGLSIKAHEEDLDGEAAKTYARETNMESVTLGDKLKDKLAKLTKR